MALVPEHNLDARYSVVIVGAGPTGLTLANLLGVENVRVLLIEQHASTVQEPRAVSIDDESLRTMQAIGIVEEVLARTIPGCGLHYYSADGHCFAQVEPDGKPYGYPRRSVFHQPTLERQLCEALQRFDQIETAFGYTLESFSQNADSVSLCVTRPGEHRVEIECDYLVGCDGASSAVRGLLGISLAGSTFSERWLVVDLENAENSSPHTKVFCNPRRPCIALPGPDQTRRFEFKLHSYEQDKDLLAPEMLHSLLAAHKANPHSVIVRKAVYRFHARLATQWSQGRVFLAGDAAHLTPPFAGQGMNSGIRDAHNLAWKLAIVLCDQMGAGILDTYEVERRDHTAAMIQMALQVGAIMAPRTRWTAWIVQNSLRALRICPAAHEYITQMKYKPKPRFLLGFIVSDGRSRHRTLVGRLFPQPPVLTQDNRSILFDEVVGNEFTLLVRTARPDLAFAATTHPVWDRLHARRVAILPQDADWCSLPGITSVREQDPAFAAIFADYPDGFIVLRPDHYVMACISASDIARGSNAVDALLQKATIRRL
jgi:3-(3-hydroxy-phenyl)propionate hydroxylase